MNNMTFFKSKDGMRVKLQSKVSGDKIKTADSFQRTRENMSAFGAGCAAGKLFRKAINDISKFAKDPRMTSRMVKVMISVINADSTHRRGERNVVDGDLGKLKSFEFNGNSEFAAAFKPNYTAVIDRATGKFSITVPEFNPQLSLQKPQYATHYRLVSAATEIDFVTGDYNTKLWQDVQRPITADIVPALDIEVDLTANSVHPLFLVFGIEFFLEDNGELYSLKNGIFNSLRVVAVSLV